MTATPMAAAANKPVPGRMKFSRAAQRAEPNKPHARLAARH
jgi:hypothetical protein